VTSHDRQRSTNGDPRPVIEVRLDNPANGGASVGRDNNGRAIFSEGGLPGELVTVELAQQKKRFAKGRVIDVLEPSSGRIEARCATHNAGCGGCNMAHASSDLQRSIKQQVVIDSLTRIGSLDPELVTSAFIDPSESRALPERYRTTVRAALANGKAGYRRRSSHDTVSASECVVVHELLEDMLVNGRFGPDAGDEVVLRVSNLTGERHALINGDPAAVDLPDDVGIASRTQLDDGQPIQLTEHAGGRDWQVSINSFFQAGPQVATALVDAVDRAVGDRTGSTLVDAYSGIGLFAGTVGSTADTVLAVERSGSSTADARVNLADTNVEVIESPVEEWRAVPADIVIADPARSGLGEAGVGALMGTGADRFVLVACDTGSLGRDVGLLAKRGYGVDTIQIVDAFHDTSHVETIVGLSR